MIKSGPEKSPIDGPTGQFGPVFKTLDLPLFDTLRRQIPLQIMYKLEVNLEN